MQTTNDPLVSGACPSFFRAACRTAAQGGRDGYFWAGRNLGGHIIGLGGHAVSDEDWWAAVERLYDLITARDCGGTIAWFRHHLPRCIALVPPPRHQAFFDGLYDLVVTEGYDITVD